MPFQRRVRSVVLYAALPTFAGQAEAQTTAIDSVRALTGADRYDAAVAADDWGAAVEAAERCVDIEDDVAEYQFIYGESLMELAGVKGSKRKARKQAEEIYQRDRIMGLYARYRLRAEDAKEEERVEFFDEALPLAGTPADSVCRSITHSIDLSGRDAQQESVVISGSCGPGHRGA